MFIIIISVTREQMMMNQRKETVLNQRQLVTLADLILTIRPDWQQPGVTAALRQIPGELHTITAIAITNAANPAIQTPALLGQTPAAPTDSRPDRQPICDICSRPPKGCREAQDNTGHHDHDWTPTPRPDTADRRVTR